MRTLSDAPLLSAAEQAAPAAAVEVKKTTNSVIATEGGEDVFDQ